MQRFSKENLPGLYDDLAQRDKDLEKILLKYGYPPVWVRPNSFETLVLTILEQQVSLASAFAAYKKLKERIAITPENFLLLNDDQLRACYFSRQKIGYVRILATAIHTGEVDVDAFETLPDDEVRVKLKKLKGIGDWTVDIYLIHALQRMDVFPTGDLALVNAIRMVKQLPHATKDELLLMSELWKPYRSIATMLFWHFYIREKNIKLLH